MFSCSPAHEHHQAENMDFLHKSIQLLNWIINFIRAESM